MAKKAAKSGSKEINKSQAIRDYLTQNAGVGPTAVAAALNSREGWKISAAYVSTIKNKMTQPATSKRGRAASSKSGGINADSLIQAKKFIEQAGGVSQAKAALDLLARLTD